jgi:DNA-binding response OmpR family regulator
VIPRLLLIDNDPVLLSLLTKAFETEGYQVTAVPTVTDLAGLLESSRPDLVITDYLLDKGYNGHQLCCQLRALARFERLPVLLLSAWPDARMTFEQQLCQIWVTKPFKLWELLACTNELLQFYKPEA